ncbi:hypothetical protein [Carboxylicivirga marina]|uniref:hypothetical protein n=1 Tax=Carboxylicivirga marina TaxID=2800988 RepID=UPI002595A37B|nr:hypothetical protein [uncultured Carboxylicivirga sp.]
MRQQIDQYWRRLKSDNHPEKDGLRCLFSSFSFNRINVEILIVFKYIKEDLIFISGLFFVSFLMHPPQIIANTYSNPNQIMWELSHTKQLANEG